jgi:hypothetical protein
LARTPRHPTVDGHLGGSDVCSHPAPAARLRLLTCGSICGGSTTIAIPMFVIWKEYTAMTQGSFTEHVIRRWRLPLGRSYGEAIADFERVVPPIDPQRFQSLESWEENLALFDTVAPLGLMRFALIDALAYFHTSGTDRPGIEYLVGNHTIAEQMYRHEPAAMLYAPLRVFIYADDAGQGVFVIDQPSTLFGSLGDRADVAAVGRLLDHKVAAVLSAMGVDAPAALTQVPIT